MKKFGLRFMMCLFFLACVAFTFLSIWDEARVWDHGASAFASAVFACIFGLAGSLCDE